MRSLRKMFSSISVALTLSLLLSGCSFPLGQSSDGYDSGGSGGQGPNAGKETQKTETAGGTAALAGSENGQKLYFQKSFPIELVGPGSGYLSRNLWGDLFDGDLYLLAEFIMEDSEPVYSLYIADGDTGKAEKQELTLPDTDIENSYIASLDLLPDGTLSLRRVCMDSDEEFLIRMDREGNLLDPEEAFPDEESYPWNPRGFSGDNRGVFDDLKGGTILSQPDLSAGTVSLVRFDPESGKRESLGTLQGNHISGLCTDGEDIFYCVLDGRIVRYDRKENACTALLSLYEYGISPYMAGNNCLFWNASKNLVLCAMDEDTPTMYVFSEEEEAVESEIQLAQIFTHEMEDIQALTVRFSQTHSQVPIRIKRVTDADRLYIDMATGKEGPELLWLPTEGYHTLREQGLLLDLTDLIPEDTMEQIFPSVLQLGTYDGKLTAIASATRFTSMIASDTVTQGDSWSLADFWELIEEQENLEMPLLFVGEPPTYYTLFYQVFFWDPSRFIDLEKGVCNFDNDDFRKILEFCKKYGVEENTVEVEAAEMLRDGRSLADCVSSYVGIYTFSNALREYGDDFHIVGIPTYASNISSHASTGSGGYLAVSANATHIEEIRDFLTKFLSYDYQRGLLQPIRKDAMQAKSLPGNYLEGADEAEAKKILLRWEEMKEEYIQMAENSVPYQGQTFGSILGPELANYFNDSKSLDETIRVITNRVQLYLNENK